MKNTFLLFCSYYLYSSIRNSETYISFCINITNFKINFSFYIIRLKLVDEFYNVFKFINIYSDSNLVTYIIILVKLKQLKILKILSMSF